MTRPRPKADRRTAAMHGMRVARVDDTLPAARLLAVCGYYYTADPDGTGFVLIPDGLPAGDEAELIARALSDHRGLWGGHTSSRLRTRLHTALARSDSEEARDGLDS